MEQEAKYDSVMNVTDTQLLYIAAFRYALGRQTYVVPAIAGAIRESRDLLTDDTARLMAREIVECNDLGMECDADMWLDLAAFLMEGCCNDEGRA